MVATSRVELNEVLKTLKTLANPKVLDGMSRFGITPRSAYGVSIPKLRELAKAVGQSHELALRLWEIDIRETRILAGMVAEPGRVSGELMEDWVKAFDYWEICDQICQNLFEKSALAYAKAIEWSSREKEFVKRAGFVLMARLAVSDKDSSDERFLKFLPLVEREAKDDRATVKKAINWALRQIGKRNALLNQYAIATALRIKETDSKNARWIAGDALRELQSPAVQGRLKKSQLKGDCISVG